MDKNLKSSRQVAIYIRTRNNDYGPTDLHVQRRRETCQGIAQAAGCWVVAEYVDYGSANAALSRRPALLRLLSALKAGAFDCVVMTELSQLSRRREQLVQLRKKIRDAGVQLITIELMSEPAQLNEERYTQLPVLMRHGMREARQEVAANA